MLYKFTFDVDVEGKKKEMYQIAIIPEESTNRVELLKKFVKFLNNEYSNICFYLKLNLDIDVIDNTQVTKNTILHNIRIEEMSK